jgi:hypothetical protein
MNPFRGVIFDELWGRVVGMDLDLVDGRNDLKVVRGVVLVMGKAKYLA